MITMLRRAGRYELTLLLWFIWVAVVQQAEPTIADATCQCRQGMPRENSPPLLFCNWYRASSCCLPAHDADMQDKFLALVAAGPTCEKFLNRAKLFLAMVFCYGCDPEMPLHFSQPLNTGFFSASKTVKICSSVANHIEPSVFSDCGFTLADDRETLCSPNSPIDPPQVWPDCRDGQYVCMTSAPEWYCSPTPCVGDTPNGFADMPCNSTERTCSGALKMMNDNRAAKPPNFEDYPVEIVDETLCLALHANASRCSCMRSAVSRASQLQRPQSIRLQMVLTVIAAILMH